MRFGPVPPSEAVGAVLAHSLRVDGEWLRKGTRLGPGDVASLEAAGIAEVTVARLEEGDVGEDEAAAAAAAALAGAGVRAGEAATGRANLRAGHRGLAVVDAGLIRRLNGIDEALTVATVSPDARVEPRGLLATVKAIPMGLPEKVVEGWREEVEGTGNPLRVVPFAPHRAGLVLTTLPGSREEVLASAERAMDARLRALGSRLDAVVRTPHEVEGVAREVEGLLGRGLSPVLVLGASSVVDREDVLPRAIRRAGGEVERLGMPVDPGNLLLLGRRDGTPVVGVPGCARSPGRSGFDAVLERLLAGLPVDAGTIAAMGVGGLLAEIPGRPSPRAASRKEEEAEPRIAGVVLAAGRSLRWEGGNKLLEEVDGTPLVGRVVDALLDASLSPVVVVTGHESGRMEAALEGRPVRFVENPDPARGMSGSIRTGIDALPGAVDGAIIALGDMPWLRASSLRALTEASGPAGEGAICVPVHRRKRGNPVLWPRRFFPELRGLVGDIGARELLSAHAGEVREVPVDDPGVLLDVDTPASLREARPDG